MTSIKSERFALALLLGVLVANANADEQVSMLSEEDFLADIPVVLTATRLAQPINEAPAAMTIIDRQMIEASGARDIADLFKLVPGFQVQHENGHTPIVTYNGLSDQFSRRMQVLVDGRSVYGPVFGGVDWAQLPLVMDDIERIEVTRGPNAASYGANAFLAIINIITRHASETTGFFTRYTTGSDKIKDGVLRYGNTTGNLDYRLTLGYTSDAGFPDRYDEKRIHLARFRSDYVAGTKDAINVQAGYNNASRGLDSDNLFPGQTLDKKVIDRFQQIRWAHEISHTQDLQIQYYHNDHVVDEFWRMDNAPDLVALLASFGITGLDVTHSLDNSYRAERHDLEIQHTYAPNKYWRVAWGGSVRRDLLFSNESDKSISPKYDLKRLFANSEWHAEEHWLFNLGAMAEDNDFTGKSISPRAAIHFKVDNSHTFRVVASRATRTPSLIENNGEILVLFSGPAMSFVPPGVFAHEQPLLLSQQDLNAEKITSLEVGYNASYPRAGMSLDFKLFKNRVENLISAPSFPGPGIPDLRYIVPTNGDNVTVRGVESYLDLKNSNRIRIIFSYAYTIIDSPDTYQAFSTTVPRHNISALISKDFENHISASLGFYRVSEAKGLEDGDMVPAHNRADFRIAFPFSGNGIRGDVAFVTQNFLGSYNDWRNDNTFGSRHFVSMNAHF